MTALCALESLKRTGNLTGTRHEIGVSQRAVSRRLKVLEDDRGTSLFLCDRKSITLYPAARDYCTQIRNALDKIGTASLRLKVNPGGGQLNIAMLPAFGVRWLAPRLRPFDFEAEPFYGAVHFGERDSADVCYLELMREYVVPVASPKLAAARKDDTGYHPRDMFVDWLSEN
ncbi:LysR family transcriptional regulator [Tropicibacter sp. S64]|uniref:LysR family transcriptional regulator n=1 Tax=Tropicibacter sp. S64 TaxID=3415122 RepID=UPI003C7E3CF8